MDRPTAGHAQARALAGALEKKDGHVGITTDPRCARRCSLPEGSHFSQRHADEVVYEWDAAEVFPNVVVVRDLTVVAVPARR